MIKILDRQVASRIAAGEVIDRPSAIVRELLDNSIDAGADEIEIRLQHGGIEAITVIDNGIGMERDDLEICHLSHATSKLRQLSDLDSIHSLGFRGEALPSIAASARLSIVSRAKNSETAWQSLIDDNRQTQISESKRAVGVTIKISKLFHKIPARKKFLKSPAAEANSCRQVIADKSLAFPDVAFKLYLNDKLKLFLPADATMQRVLTLYPQFSGGNLLRTAKERQEHGCAISAIFSTPALYRNDKRLLQLFINKRRVYEYNVLRAVEHEYRNILPGGRYPVAFIFVTLPPQQLDVNIHPAKKEVKLHRPAIVAGLAAKLTNEHLAAFTRVMPEINHINPLSRAGGHDPQPQTERSGLPFTGHFAANLRQKELSIDELRRMPALYHTDTGEKTEWQTADTAAVYSPRDDYRYIGQLFELFLLVEWGGKLLLIDQHAAHERILFDRFQSGRNSRQKLLLPYPFNIEEGETEQLKQLAADYRFFGIEFQHIAEERWQLVTIADIAEDQEAVVCSIFAEQCPKERLARQLFSRLSCRKAIKQGDKPDRVTACRLIEQTLALAEPRCPHGRPLWIELSKERLFDEIGR